MKLTCQSTDDGHLSEDACRQVVAATIDQAQPDGRRVLVIIPDHTRTCPLPMMARLVHSALAGRAEKLDFLIALGTHPPMSDERIDSLLGIEPGRREDVLPGCEVFNHEWDNPQALAKIGTLTSDHVNTISEGRFAMDVDVTVNKRALDYDLAIVLGPVFPHEVVGFSGGAKYFFPGICGPELLNFFHWLGAVITNPKIIGNKWTPVRKVVDRAAAMVPAERRALCLVVKGKDLAGLYHGTPEEAWSAAADLSRQVHISYQDRAYHTVLSCAPKMYDDLWTGGKCMYKLEPAVADGGRLIIYAPHITEVSVTHGKEIRLIGYHTRDYFLKQWDRFKHHPWGILAHSTHVKGIGTYDHGVEKPRVDVILATGIPEEVCKEINLGFMDHREIDPADYGGREREGVLHVPKAGETLYRWKDAPPELGGDG